MDFLSQNVDGSTIRYCDTGGDGPVVLLTHGIGASLETWSAQLAAADGRLRMIAWDLPGHGLSDFGDQPYSPAKFASFAWRFLDALDVGNVSLAGNSLGGGVSIAMADLQPRRVDRLILLDAATLGRAAPLPFRLMSLPLVGEILSKPSALSINQQLDALFYRPSTITKDIRAIVTRNVMRPGADKAFIATLRQMTNLRGQRAPVVKASLKTLSALRAPALFIHGRQDAVLPLEHSVRAQRATPDSRLLVLEACGHTPQIEKADEISTAIRQFILS